MRHSLISALALLMALGLLPAPRVDAAQKIADRRQSVSGQKIEYSDPIDPILAKAEKKKATSSLPDTMSMLTRNGSPMDDLSAMPDMAPEVVPAKKQKKNDWLKDGSSGKDPLSDLEKAASPYTLDNSFTRAWGSDDSDNSEQSRPSNRTLRKMKDRNSLSDNSDGSTRGDDSRSEWTDKNDSKNGRSNERGWRSAFGDSSFRKLGDSMRDQYEEQKNKEDRQNRMNEFRALYNMSSSTTPVGAPNSANPIHESLWQSSDRQRFDVFSAPPQSTFSRPASPSRLPGFDPGDANSAPIRSRQYQYQGDAQNQRYQAPTMLEIPKPPGSLMR